MIKLPLFSALFIVMCLGSCSDKPKKHTNPVGPGGGDDTTQHTTNSTGSWSLLSGRLVLTDTVTPGGCVMDGATFALKYDTTRHIKVASMVYSLTSGGAQLMAVYPDTTPGFIRLDTFRFARQGTDTGITGTWVSGPALPGIHYVSGSQETDSQSVWLYAASSRDTLKIGSDRLYAWSQNIGYTTVPDDMSKDSVLQMLNAYKSAVPSLVITPGANSWTVTDPKLTSSLVITYNGNYPGSSKTATFNGKTGTVYMKPASTAECQSEDSFSVILGDFYDALQVAYPKRAARAAR